MVLISDFSTTLRTFGFREIVVTSHRQIKPSFYVNSRQAKVTEAEENGMFRQPNISGHVGFVVDKVALGQVFSEYFGFSFQSSFHKLLYNHHYLSSGAGIIGQ
jgi:hypothetical protein